MPDILNDTTEHEHAAPGADEAAEGNAHGKHRGSNAPDDNFEADPHGRHRR